jgi:spermidine/putrescine transport system permease protein
MVQDGGKKQTRRRFEEPQSRSAYIAALLLVAPSTIWLMLFVVAPLALLIVMSFWTSGIFGLSMEFTLDNYRILFSDPVYFLVLLQTLRIAMTVTASTLLLSYPVAYFIASSQSSRRTGLLLLLFIPFWSSYIVRTFVWLPMLGRNGLVNNALLGLGLIETPLDWLLYNSAATHIGLIYVYTLFMALPIYLSLDRIDRRLTDAAADLGAGPIRTFVRVTLPLSMPGVTSGCVMVFMLCCGAYVTPQLLGGTSGLMIGNIIAAQYLTTNNWTLGAALSLSLVGIVLLTLAVFGRHLRLDDAFLKG